MVAPVSPHLCNGHSLLCAQLGSGRLLSQQLDTRCPCLAVWEIWVTWCPHPVSALPPAWNTLGLGLSTSPAALKVPEGKVCLLPLSPQACPGLSPSSGLQRGQDTWAVAAAAGNHRGHLISPVELRASHPGARLPCSMTQDPCLSGLGGAAVPLGRVSGRF